MHIEAKAIAYGFATNGVSLTMERSIFCFCTYLNRDFWALCSSSQSFSIPSPRKRPLIFSKLSLDQSASRRTVSCSRSRYDLKGDKTDCNESASCNRYLGVSLLNGGWMRDDTPYRSHLSPGRKISMATPTSVGSTSFEAPRVPGTEARVQYCVSTEATWRHCVVVRAHVFMLNGATQQLARR